MAHLTDHMEMFYPVMLASFSGDRLSLRFTRVPEDLGFVLFKYILNERFFNVGCH